MTRELGRQTKLDVTDQLRRELNAERFIRLNRMLMGEQRVRQFATGQRHAGDNEAQPAATEWASTLCRKLGLAQQIDPGVWHLNASTESALRTMGERGDIIDSIYRPLQANDGKGRSSSRCIAKGASARPRT